MFSAEDFIGPKFTGSRSVFFGGESCGSRYFVSVFHILSELTGDDK